MEYFAKYTSFNLTAWGRCICKVKYLGRAHRHGPMVDCLTLKSSFCMQVSCVLYFYYIWIYAQGSSTVLSILIWFAITTVFHMFFGLLRSNYTKSHVYELFKVFHFLHTTTLIHQFNILMKKLNYNLILDSINLCKNFETSNWIFHNYDWKILSLTTAYSLIVP
jgi:hypothetical protein